MFELKIPNFKNLRLKNLVLDFNGTVSQDGKLLPGVSDRLVQLKESFEIYVITSDTFGSVTEQIHGLGKVKILQSNDHKMEKYSFVTHLGEDSSVAIGNGRNDVAMLEAASLGIAVCQGEGLSSEALTAANVVCTNILSALDQFINPLRLTATLRG